MICHGSKQFIFPHITFPINMSPILRTNSDPTVEPKSQPRTDHQIEKIHHPAMPSKAEVCSELDKMGVVYLPKMSMAELTTLLKRARGGNSTKVEEKKFRLKKNPMTGVNKMKKQAQQALLIMLGGIPMRKMTKGDLELEIREKLDAGLQQVMPHGKYQKSSIEAIIETDDQGYYEWVVETINSTSHESFILLKAVILMMFQGQLDSFSESMESGDDEPVLPKTKTEYGKTVPKDERKESGSPGRKSRNDKQESKPSKGGATSSKEVPKMTAAKSMLRPKVYQIYTEEEESLSDTPPSIPPQEEKKKLYTRTPQEESSGTEAWMEIGEKRRR